MPTCSPSHCVHSAELAAELAATRAELTAFGAAVAAWPERLLMRVEALRRLLPEAEDTQDVLRAAGASGPILGASDGIEALARDHTEGLARQARRMAKELADLAKDVPISGVAPLHERLDASEHQENQRDRR